MRQHRSHKYILVSGLIASSMYVILSYFLIEGYEALDLLIQFIVFYAVWIGIQYLLFRRKGNQDK